METEHGNQASAARSRPAKARPTISPARCALIRCSRAPEPARVAGASVTFEPGARTAWHTHPLGQTLIVTAGCGWVQREGGPVEEIRPGDVVWFAPGEKHWHGATATTAMTHIAIQEGAQRQGRRLDGEGHRRAIPGRIKGQLSGVITKGRNGRNQCRSAHLEAAGSTRYRQPDHIRSSTPYIQAQGTRQEY